MDSTSKLEQSSASSESIENLIRQLATEKPERFSHKDIVSFTSNFETKIGSGGFGNVYRGQFPNGVQVAVKVLVEKDVVEEIFTAELTTMGRTHHRNLVKLYGFCFEANMKALVYEYMKYGSLDKFLYENQSSIKWEKLYEIAVQTAKGLLYLHDGCYEQIIHRDIKAANVLLHTDHSPKITDFGLANLMDRDLSHFTMTRIRGTFGYVAPETVMPFSRITYKCDVYSFGMMLFEILGRRRNKQGQDWFPKQVWDKFRSGQFDEIIDDCGITAENRQKAKTLCLVAFWCIQYTPETRPSMSSVLTTLENEIQVTRPPNPFLPSDLTSSMQPFQYFQEVIYSAVLSLIHESKLIPSKQQLQENTEERPPISSNETHEEKTQVTKLTSPVSSTWNTSKLDHQELSQNPSANGAEMMHETAMIVSMPTQFAYPIISTPRDPFISSPRSSLEHLAPEKDGLKPDKELVAQPSTDPASGAETDVTEWYQAKCCIDETRTFIVYCGANSNLELVIKAEARTNDPNSEEIVRVLPRPNILRDMKYEEIQELFSEFPEVIGEVFHIIGPLSSITMYTRFYKCLAEIIPPLRNLASEINENMAERHSSGEQSTPEELKLNREFEKLALCEETLVEKWYQVKCNTDTIGPPIIVCGTDSNSDIVIKVDTPKKDPKGKEIVRVLPKPSVLRDLTFEEIQHLFSRFPKIVRDHIHFLGSASAVLSDYSQAYMDLAKCIHHLGNKFLLE